MAEDLYSVLGVPRHASMAAIKQAYRLQALRCHPDKSSDPADHERFKQLSEAASVLSDPDRRKRYDQFGSTSQEADFDADALLQELMLELVGGSQMLDMLRCMSEQELASAPPFPLPSELFPPSTFPPGLRFRGLAEVWPTVEAALRTGDLSLLFGAMLQRDDSDGEEEDTDDDDDASSAGEWVEVDSDDRRSSSSFSSSSSSTSCSPLPSPAAACPAGAAAHPGPSPGLCRAWIDAAKAGDVAALQRLHAREPALLGHHAPGLGHTAAHWAAARDHAAALRWLLQQGLGPNTTNHNGATPLHAAARNGALQAAAVLLDQPGMDVGARDEDNLTAEQLAVQFKQEGVRALLQQPRGQAAGQGAGPNSSHSSRSQSTAPATATTTTTSGAAGAPSAQAAAAAARSAPAGSTSTAQPVQPSGEASPQVEVSIADGAAASAAPQAAVAPDTKHSSKPPSAAQPAVDAAGPGRPRAALSAEAKAARRAQLAAAVAASEERAAHEEAEDAAERRRALAAAGTTDEEGCAWLSAAKEGHLGALQALLAANPRLLHYGGKGTKFAFSGNTAAHWAAAGGHVSVLAWLLQQAGADVQARNRSGSTPLHAALRNAQALCGRRLVLEWGADPLAVDDEGESALAVAQQSKALPTGLAAALPLLHAAHSLHGQTPQAWNLKAIRALLGAAGVETHGMLEKSELVAACQQVLARLQ